MTGTKLDGLRKLSDYRTGRNHIFRSDGSLQWFVRMHKARLIERGALRMLAGQWYADEARFDEYVLEASQAAAKAAQTPAHAQSAD